MAYGACDDCGCSFNECECEDRRKAAEENKRQKQLARDWEAQRPKEKAYGSNSHL